MQQNTVKNYGMFTRYGATRNMAGKQRRNEESGGNGSEPQMGHRESPDDKSGIKSLIDRAWTWLGDPDATE